MNSPNQSWVKIYIIYVVHHYSLILAKVCPGFAIGCSLCSLYNPVACGPTCTVAAFYCGFGAYACAAEAEAEAEAGMTEAPTASG